MSDSRRENTEDPIKPSELEKDRSRLLAKGQELDEQVLQALQRAIALEVTWRLLIGRQHKKLDAEYRTLGADFSVYDKEVDTFSEHVWLHLKTSANEHLIPLHHRRDSFARHLSQLLDLLTTRDTQITTRLAIAGTFLSVLLAIFALLFTIIQDQETKQTVAKFDERMQSQIGLMEKLNEGLAEQVTALKQQGSILQTQLDVTKRQIELERLLRSQKPNLLLEVWLTPEQSIDNASKSISFDFVIQNNGQKLAEQTFFNIWVPAELKIKAIKPPLGKIAEHVPAVIKGKNYTVLRGMQSGPIPMKGPGFRLGSIVVELLPGDYVFLWKLSANGEEFPLGEKLGEYSIRLSPPQADKKS